jgi:hypothetical protein
MTQEIVENRPNTPNLLLSSSAVYRRARTSGFCSGLALAILAANNFELNVAVRYRRFFAGFLRADDTGRPTDATTSKS